MNLQDRIKKVEPYFVAFNIEEGCAYITTEFKKKTWVVPNTESLKDLFKVKTVKQENYIYFFTEIENGIECLFDALEYTITFNIALEEKEILFRQKIEELKNLFSNEDINKLRCLEFVFKKAKKANKKTKTINEIDVSEVNDEITTKTTESENEVVENEESNTVSANTTVNLYNSESLLEIAEELAQ